MSDDLYDSLEDECHDSRGSSDSLDLHQTVSIKNISNLQSYNRHSSFCFGNKKEMDFSPNTKTIPVNASHKNNFLPSINNKNSMPGLQEIFNHSADHETLSKKGLLLNRDGSFTKSKSDVEELPFITREYKNLVFQKEKWYNSKKKTKTKGFSEKQMSNCDLFCSRITSDRKPEEVLKRKSSFDETREKVDKNSVMNDNLTDSMKRILLQNHNQKNKQRSLEQTYGRQKPKCSLSETKTLRHRFSRRSEKKMKDCKPLNKHLSQSALNDKRHSLSYLERHQLQNGYNPWFLRSGVKKITSDTTRSTFGDSVTGKLSEVSSRVISDENIADLEAEEEFYKGMMGKEQNKGIKRESKIVGRQQFEVRRQNSKVGSDSFRGLEKLRDSGRRTQKRILKPLSIDIKSDGERAANKCSHYCSSHSSPKMSKTELALKAKTYGFLANARNILKFKSRTEEKISGRENLSPKYNVSGPCFRQASEFTLDIDDSEKKSLPKLSASKKVRSRTEYKLRQVENEAEKSVNEGTKRFYLPHVSSSEHKNRRKNSKNLMRMSSCLYCPNHQNENRLIVH